MSRNKRKQDEARIEEDQRDDRLRMEGIVVEALPGTLFKVRCDNDLIVLCTLAGKIRLNHINLCVGDHVTIEVSPYDVSRGRVQWRHR